MKGWPSRSEHDSVERGCDMFEETKKLLQRAQDANTTLGELSDQREPTPRLVSRILMAALALGCLAALIAAAVAASR